MSQFGHLTIGTKCLLGTYYSVEFILLDYTQRHVKLRVCRAGVDAKA